MERNSDLVLSDPKLAELMILPSKLSKLTLGDRRHFRHSLDDRYLLWHTSVPELRIVDASGLQVAKTLEDFWLPKLSDANNCQVEPIAAVSDQTASSLAGLANLFQMFGVTRVDVDQMMVYSKPSANIKQEFLISELFPKRNQAFMQ